jgi:hypothetical protein
MKLKKKAETSRKKGKRKVNYRYTRVDVRVVDKKSKGKNKAK